jgi:hypothetical protein
MEPVNEVTTTAVEVEDGEKKMKVDPWTAKHVNYDKLVEVISALRKY